MQNSSFGLPPRANRRAGRDVATRFSVGNLRPLGVLRNSRCAQRPHRRAFHPRANQRIAVHHRSEDKIMSFFFVQFSYRTWFDDEPSEMQSLYFDKKTTSPNTFVLTFHWVSIIEWRWRCSCFSFRTCPDAASAAPSKIATNRAANRLPFCWLSISLCGWFTLSKCRSSKPIQFKYAINHAVTVYKWELMTWLFDFGRWIFMDSYLGSSCSVWLFRCAFSTVSTPPLSTQKYGRTLIVLPAYLHEWRFQC